MRKIKIYIIPLIILGFSLFHGGGAAAQNALGLVDATALNVRARPSTAAEIIGTLSDREKINIITKTEEAWYKIEFAGAYGYVHIDYVFASRSGEPVVQKPSSAPQTSAGAQSGQEVVSYAKTFLGTPYLWAGSSPAGFDCSGFVQYVYKHFGITLNRVSADQTAHGAPVSRENLQPGDLVFFHNTGVSSRINHVGIYVGGGSFIHSPQTGDVVKVSTLENGYYGGTFITARRIFE